jgi:hypothetical protein
MPGKNLGILPFLVSHGVVAATVVTVFFGSGFQLLTHPMLPKRAKTATVTIVTSPAPIATTVPTTNQSAPARPPSSLAPPATTVPTANQPAATAATTVPPTNQSAPTRPPSSLVPPATTVPTANEPAATATTGDTYRDARLRYLRNQQALIEQKLTDPNLSEVENARLKRKEAYWVHSIERTLALPPDSH